nr:hypothetical protein [Tanacetum cinerariifolium]
DGSGREARPEGLLQQLRPAGRDRGRQAALLPVPEHPHAPAAAATQWQPQLLRTEFAQRRRPGDARSHPDDLRRRLAGADDHPGRNLAQKQRA